MKSTRMRLIHLHRSNAITRPLMRKILERDPKLESLYDRSANDLSHLYQIPFSRALQLFHDLHNTRIIQSIIQDEHRYHISTVLDPSYPPLLRSIPDPPYVLYMLGNPSLLYQLPTLSVVGTRNPSCEARQKMNHILLPLIKEGWIIVSGMALGIDGIAHQLAEENNGKTIAVIGSGFNHIYPSQHQLLFKALIKNQLVISEYPPQTPPKRYHFPERNRIISGLGIGTIVIEAKEKSGSLITVDQALEQGRDVFAVPGSILFEQTSGCHKMIQDGAKLVQSTYDILEEWHENEVKWCRFLSDNKENYLANHMNN
ncbi:DNA-processing protein DprA [Aquibacillus koreensis]|uniref:DNA-processing protein DprA n=1 Tax=Aquibacillus koreensis TaxID=279446 RepID=A0A9X3WPG1_9BACI|nr:DNA-processing protein DprA [Aquibacillus koreensis]MCT2534510.1 DNA-processing protein DprA [Aquibacillus koreensis]MDC3421896.1 DNA-processing protein DprA [Aquibacillus koreensis]